MKLILATQNNDKIYEMKKLIEENNLNYQIYSLKDLDILDEVEENGKTLEENAYKKAKGYYDILLKKGYTDFIVIADDSGLFVEALDGRPGIYSARYAGVGCTYLDNRLKLLQELKDKKNRNAYFQTSLCMITAVETKFFNGKTEGRIYRRHVGKKGFGYDSLFYSNELKKSFGVASSFEKGLISHRGKAVRSFIAYLKEKEDRK